MRFSFFAVLATAVSAASLNAMVDNDYTFDLYEAEDLDYAQAWDVEDVKKTEETATKAADDQARMVKQASDLETEAEELKALANKMIENGNKAAGK